MGKEEISLFDDQKFETDHKKSELKAIGDDSHLIKSKGRVRHHGEVFTPKWMVEKMLSEPAIQEKLHDLHATFFEPSAGEGAFPEGILHQKLSYVDQISNRIMWKNNTPWTLTSIYAIELLQDNLIKAKRAMIDVFINHYRTFVQKALSSNTDLYKSARYTVGVNIIQRNTLTLKNSENRLVEFREWIPSGNKVKQNTFTYKSLFNNDDMDDVNASERQLSLFDDSESGDLKQNQPVRLTKVYEV